MGILTWILLGLIVGALAKFIMPGNDAGGIFVTMLIGVAGAFVGGFVASFFGIGGVSGINLVSVLVALGGALLLLFAYRLVKN